MEALDQAKRGYNYEKWNSDISVSYTHLDICVALQFILQINIPLIWLFYLPSQVYYAKMVPSSEDRTTV